MHSFSHAHCLAAGRGRRSCLALYGSASGSGLRSPYASSPTHQAVSCSTLLYLWTGSSSPVASHPAFRRRSFLRLRTASVLSDGDFHPTVGAHSQAHVGMRSRASRRRLSDNDIRCSASDRRWFPARPAQHVHRGRNNGKGRIPSALASAHGRNGKRRVETCNGGVTLARAFHDPNFSDEIAAAVRKPAFALGNDHAM